MKQKVGKAQHKQALSIGQLARRVVVSPHGQCILYAYQWLKPHSLLVPHPGAAPQPRVCLCASKKRVKSTPVSHASLNLLYLGGVSTQLEANETSVFVKDVGNLLIRLHNVLK